MSTPKLLLYLAASDFSDGEIEDFFEWVELSGATRACRSIDQLRLRAQQFDKAASRRTIISAIADQERSKRNQNEGPHASMIDAVERLLLQELGLTKGQATRALMQGLAGVPSEYETLPDPRKISFRQWLAKVGKEVSDSQVLHVANKIRNEVVHGKRSISEWPI